MSDRAILGQRPPFLATHLAQSARPRQQARIVAEVERLVNGLHSAGALEKPLPRSSPDRYVLQAGLVALTIAWLRGASDSVAEGTLLVIVWRGVIGPRRAPETERNRAAPASTATSVWEDIVSVTAESEAAWRWCPAGAPAAGFNSEELAGRMVQRLELAHHAALVA